MFLHDHILRHWNERQSASRCSRKQEVGQKHSPKADIWVISNIFLASGLQDFLWWRSDWAQSKCSFLEKYISTFIGKITPVTANCGGYPRVVCFSKFYMRNNFTVTSWKTAGFNTTGTVNFFLKNTTFVQSNRLPMQWRIENIKLFTRPWNNPVSVSEYCWTRRQVELGCEVCKWLSKGHQGGLLNASALKSQIIKGECKEHGNNQGIHLISQKEW